MVIQRHQHRGSNMPSDKPQYEHGARICKQGLVDPVYDLDDQNFPQKLDFRPHKPGLGYLERCKVIPKFHGFKTLSPADMKERKRVLVQESEFQSQNHAVNGRFSASEVSVYKGIILEKRQQSLTGKETFDVYEIYTEWEEQDSKTGEKRLKEVCIRWDMFNGRVQLYALVYMVHPNKKAESGKFLEANGLVELSMVPHKDNPKKVATGGNWAGQGYWVPYVVALHYVRHWSFDYRHLFVVIWGSSFPGTCKRLGEHGYRENILGAAVVAAARRESRFFFGKAMALAREPLQSNGKKPFCGNIPGTSIQRIAPLSTLDRCNQQSSSMQHLALSSSPQGRLHFTPSLATIHDTKYAHDLLPPPHTSYYDPVREMRTHRFVDQQIEPLSNQSTDWNSRYPHNGYTYGGEPQSGSVQNVVSRKMFKESGDPHEEWGKRKRGPEEALSRSPRKKHEEKRLPRGEAVLYERQTDGRYFIRSDNKVQDIWLSGERNPRGYEAEKGWQRQEQEAAAALMLLAGDEAALLGRAAITA